MNERVKTLIVDDHPLFASATKALLEQMEDIEVIGIVSSAAQCLQQVSLLQPGLVFLDYHLPDQHGTEVAAQIKNQFPDTHIVIFSGIELTDIYNKLIDIQVSGVLSKESSERTIKNMVNCILDNHTMMPLALYHQCQLNGTLASKAARLEEEEILMMNLLVKGATLDQIAARIHMSKRTVDNYLRKIYDKLDVRTRTEAIESFIKSSYYS
ncbi:response regulator transcription factor [Paenibacillus sp. CF384]|uniref:response regulator transcription factor n=1 Tax=Paenibacillus sp. CF384 TaxID=1884382 RepID=UPI00089C197B|nr:response regulator transcription factor [Paenibacillus sp. CF384]SDW68617.1 two component transcriptional regulator, LuxR family [Paenibacillus sp. CF384]